MTFDSDALPKVLEIYLEITQYPTLAPAIRQRMRDELFGRGVISPGDFDQEVKNKAMASQAREGLTDPFAQEPEEIWLQRVDHYRDTLTDFYFAHNLPHALFERIVHDVLAKRVPERDIFLSFNPELAPWSILFDRGEAYEQLPPEQRARVQHHLREIVVVLLKSLISDHLDFVGIAKNLFSIEDLKFVRSRRIGRGKVGGKAAGMLLGWKILQLADSLEGAAAGEYLDLGCRVVMPESYFIGADVFYDFMALNDLHSLNDQKYKPRHEIEADYPRVRQAFVGGRFPDNIVQGLREVLDQVGHRPLIVRSSSLLEDNHGTSFAGKYESIFLPNQGTPQENLQDLLLGISQVYASVFSPDALFYRQQVGLLDYDERMAILLQEVQGERHGDYFFPTLAGVAFSHNPFRWSPKIRREDGFLRLVWGMGTRAVDRVAHDYPRMVALSHPDLRPEVGAVEIRRYSQHYADVINLAENRFETLPAKQILSMEFPSARMLVSIDKGDYLQRPLAYDPSIPANKLVLTFDNLLTRTRFVALLKRMLQVLSTYFGCSVDVEFTADIEPGHPQPDFCVHLLQCRPQALEKDPQAVRIPATVAQSDVLFTADRLVPQGRVQRIRHVIFVDPRAYAHIPDETMRLQVARVVGRLNQALGKKSFVLMGPGRWGSNNPELGVKVTYADIYDTAMLIEVGLAEADGAAPEASYGTHFFQDLIEAHIYPLAIYPDQRDAVFAWDFFHQAPNHLADLVPEAANYAEYVRVIDVAEASGGKLLEVIMDGERGKAMGYLR
ncbi:MAG: PEP/pyruvate-binding domain-containing protein, partial [Anaerolineae bacterium]